jgi:hypothetical protein
MLNFRNGACDASLDVDALAVDVDGIVDMVATIGATICDDDDIARG